MPREKYTKPPGPFSALGKIPRFEFQFRNNQRAKLAELLPSKLANLRAPADYAATAPQKVKTLTDLVIYATEQEINSHLTENSVMSEGKPINAANVQAAIRQLRKALEAFARGWVDEETADIVPADLDAWLAARDQEIEKKNLPAAKQRALAKLCQQTEIWVRQIASANGETVSEQDMLRYVEVALTYGGIKHPKLAKHRKRLAALVFPKS